MRHDLAMTCFETVETLAGAIFLSFYI